MELTSAAFLDGGEMHRDFGYKNGNIRPFLKFRGKPKGTESLTLIMDDPDAMGAVGKVWVHWVIWNITPKDEIISGRHGFMGLLGMTDFGEVGYGGPAPPDKKHTYVFKLYALDDELDRLTGKDGNDDVTKADVEKAMEGHIIEQTQLTGTYAP